jgi:hypothetical protein
MKVEQDAIEIPRVQGKNRERDKESDALPTVKQTEIEFVLGHATKAFGGLFDGEEKKRNSQAED